jgi:hypothetical protein
LRNMELGISHGHTQTHTDDLLKKFPQITKINSVLDVRCQNVKDEDWRKSAIQGHQWPGYVSGLHHWNTEASLYCTN